MDQGRGSKWRGRPGRGLVPPILPGVTSGFTALAGEGTAACPGQGRHPGLTPNSAELFSWKGLLASALFTGVSFSGPFGSSPECGPRTWGPWEHRARHGIGVSILALSPLSLRVPGGGGLWAQWAANRSFLPSWTVERGALGPTRKSPSPLPVSRTAHGQQTRLSGPPWRRSLAAEGSSLHAAPLKTERCSPSTPCIKPSLGR